MEKRYTPEMGMFNARVTYVRTTLLGLIPLKTLYKYRETYYGKVKDCADCLITA